MDFVPLEEGANLVETETSALVAIDVAAEPLTLPVAEVPRRLEKPTEEIAPTELTLSTLLGTEEIAVPRMPPFEDALTKLSPVTEEGARFDAAPNVPLNRDTKDEVPSEEAVTPVDPALSTLTRADTLREAVNLPTDAPPELLGVIEK